MKLHNTLIVHSTVAQYTAYIAHTFKYSYYIHCRNALLTYQDPADQLMIPVTDF